MFASSRILQFAIVKAVRSIMTYGYFGEIVEQFAADIYAGHGECVNGGDVGKLVSAASQETLIKFDMLSMIMDGLKYTLSDSLDVFDLAGEVKFLPEKRDIPIFLIEGNSQLSVADGDCQSSGHISAPTVSVLWDLSRIQSVSHDCGLDFRAAENSFALMTLSKVSVDGKAVWALPYGVLVCDRECLLNYTVSPFAKYLDGSKDQFVRDATIEANVRGLKMFNQLSALLSCQNVEERLNERAPKFLFFHRRLKTRKYRDWQINRSLHLKYYINDGERLDVARDTIARLGGKSVFISY